MPGKLDIQRILDEIDENQELEVPTTPEDRESLNRETDIVKEEILGVLDEILNPTNN